MPLQIGAQFHVMGTGQMLPSDTWHSGDLLYNQNTEAPPAKSKSFMLELERVGNIDIFVLDKSCMYELCLSVASSTI